MFYCDECGFKNGYLITMHKSNGRCEICNRTALCNDVKINKTSKDFANVVSSFESCDGCEFVNINVIHDDNVTTISGYISDNCNQCKRNRFLSDNYKAQH